MKKIFTIAMVIALVAAFTVPAMAETKFSFNGAYRVRGFMLSNPSLQGDQLAVKDTGKAGTSSYTAAIPATGEGASQSWMDMRFRMESTFTVSERLAVVTRFDALDNRMYGQADALGTSSNIDFDRAYMVVKTDFGKFQAGRMAGGTYGNVFLDTETERDRVRFDTMLDKWVMSLVYEKRFEGDAGTLWTDTDVDFYYAAATYVSEDLRGGVLVGYGNAKNNSEAGIDTGVSLVDPFINANFGDFNITAEAQMLFGKYMEFDRDLYKNTTVAGYTAARNARGIKGEQPDVDYDAYAWNLEGNWASGPFSAQLGYAWVKGEDNPFDDKYESVGGLGDDWGKAFILTNTDSGFEGSLGGHAGVPLDSTGVTPMSGNLASGSMAALNGCKMIYLGGSYSPLSNLTISGLFANSKSESPGYVGFTNDVLTSTNPADSRHYATDHGSEYDLTIDWDIYDNLNYTFIAAYLDAGDYWQFGNPYREIENTWCFWQQLQLSF